MNSDKQAPSRQRGNVMIYILIALGLLGALTYAMTRQADQSSGENLDKEAIELQAAQMIAYASAAQNVVNQMIMSGSTVDTINLVNPTSTGFNTGSNVHKLYHPSGGGLNYKPAVLPPFQASSSGTPEGWYITKRNVGWTPTSATDLVLGAYSIDPAICLAINKKILGTATVITLATNNTQNLFTDFATSPLTSTECPTCEGYPSLCVNGGSVHPAFYLILEAR